MFCLLNDIALFIFITLSVQGTKLSNDILFILYQKIIPMSLYLIQRAYFIDGENTEKIEIQKTCMFTTQGNRHLNKTGNLLNKKKRCKANRIYREIYSTAFLRKLLASH